MIYIKKRATSLLVISLLVLFLLPALSMNGQSQKVASAAVIKKVSIKSPSATIKSLLTLAKIEIFQLRYSYAIPFLKRYLKDNQPDSASLAMLGFCYKMQNQYDSAIYFYEKLDDIVIVTGNQLPELYATVGNYDAAIASYQKRLDNSTDNSTASYEVNLNRQKGFIKRKWYSKDSLDYRVNYLSINTPYNEFGAALFDSGFVFESNRSKRLTNNNEFGWDGLPFTKLYYQLTTEGISTDSIQFGNWKEKKIDKGLSDRTVATVNDNHSLQKQFGLQKLKSAPAVESPLFAPGLSGNYNFGSISFTADGKEAFFTRNQSNVKGIKHLEIWTTKRMGESFTTPVKLFFNNPAFSYFHPAVTSDGSRLFFVSDEPGGIGGTDIYVVNRKEDGGWDGTANAGGFINTPGNELFPTYYEGSLYFSSNGHEGLGGLDIFKFSFDNDPYPVPKNLGRPINSDQDDLGFSIKDQKGYFSSNRYGSDDIFSYNYQKIKVAVNGEVTVDGQKKSGITVKIISKGEDGIRAGTVIDSVVTAEDGSYVFNVRPNRNYQILIEDGKGNKSTNDITASDYVKQITTSNDSLPTAQNGVVSLSSNKLITKNNQTKSKIADDPTSYKKDLGLINFVTPKPKITPPVLKPTPKRTFISVVDSLQSVTKDFLLVHHVFDKVRIFKDDHGAYKDVVKRVSNLHGAKIVIVSATDCIGTDTYNEALSARRSKKIKTDLAKYGGNEIILIPVGEKQLVMECSDSDKDKNKQVQNRYSYVFIIQ
jgi:outer membrane protein OmpA-like peptidoglycan-associated protein